MVWDKGPISFWMWISIFFSIIYWRDYLFPIVCFWYLCQRWVDCRCVDLFLGSLLVYMSVFYVSECVLVTQSCPTLCDPMAYSLPGSSAHGILQARTLEWVAIPFSRESSWPRDQVQVSCIAGSFFAVWASRVPSFTHKWIHTHIHTESKKR